MGLGSDRAIIQRQRKDAQYERLVSSNLEQKRVENKADWENKTSAIMRENAIQRRTADIMRQRNDSIVDRKARLAQLLRQEQSDYELEMAANEETPQERVKKMTQRAYELKAKRENERQRVVQEKLYQQWREGVDELRYADSQLFKMEVLAARDQQVFEKAHRGDEEAEADRYYNKLWNEGYKAKFEREVREKQFRTEKNHEMKLELEAQVARKEREAELEREKSKKEGEETLALSIAAVKEEEEKQRQIAENARLNRKKADIIGEQQKKAKEDAAAAEAALDLQYKLENIKALENEGADLAAKAASMKDEALRDLSLRAEKKKQLIIENREMEAKQIQENLNQWAKRAEKWEKEDDYRQQLLESTYEGREEQVLRKAAERQAMIDQVVEERKVLDAKIEVLDKEEESKVGEAEKLRKEQQDGLYRQMDFHQVQRMREMQQFKLERRQAEIQEQKLQLAVKQEKKKLEIISKEIIEARERQEMERKKIDAERERLKKEAQANKPVAPWDK